MGAIASGNVRVLNDEVVRSFGVSNSVVDAVAERRASNLGAVSACIAVKLPCRMQPARQSSRRRRNRDRINNAGGGCRTAAAGSIPNRRRRAGGASGNVRRTASGSR